MPKRKAETIPVPVSGKRTKQVTLASRKKKSANRTSFAPGNQYRFAEGTSGNIGGKPKTHRLLSKTIRAMLSDPAPLAVAQAFGLGRNASWSQCISARLCRQAVAGSLEAARLIGVLSEGVNPRTNLFGFDDEFDVETAPKICEVVFVESDGNGRPKQPPVIDADSIAAVPALPASTE
jgi:hypothetical protein